MRRLNNFKNIMANEKKLSLLIFAAALLIRLAFIITYQDHALLKNISYEPDTKLYDYIAGCMLTHQMPDNTYLRDPFYPGQLVGLGYPAVLAAIYAIFGRSFLAARIIQAFMGAFTCLLLYWLGKEISGRKLGIISALLITFDPFHIYRTGSILTEVIFILLLTASILFLYKWFNSRKFYLFLLGNIFLILAGLCRAVAFGLFPFMLLWLLIILWKSKLKMLAYLSCALTFFFAVIFIWQSLLPVFFPDEQVASKGINPDQKTPFSKALLIFPANLFVAKSTSEHLGITHTDYHDWRDKLYASVQDLPGNEAREKVADEFYLFLREHPKLILKIIYERFINFYRIYPNIQEPGKPQTEFSGLKFKVISLLSYGVVLPFFILGLLVSAREVRKMFLLYAVVFLFTFIHVIHCSQIRYRLQIIPAFVIFAAVGLIWSIRGLLKSRWI